MPARRPWSSTIRSATRSSSIVFPPQTITEEAIFESSTLPTPKPDPPKAPATAPGITVLGARARARISGESRLVFRVPPAQRIPYSIAGLLDWRDLDLHVSPLADLPAVADRGPDRRGTRHQRARPARHRPRAALPADPLARW